MILFLGDTHGDHRHLAEIARSLRPCAMVHLGDVGLQKAFAEEFSAVLEVCPIHFIAGNHDFDSSQYYDHLFDGQEHANLHARVVDVQGVRVAGLAGNFQGKIWYPPQPPRFSRPQDYLAATSKGNYWRGGLPLKTRGAIWWQDYEKLADLRADVLVTHEAPGCHKYGFSELEELAEMMGVRTIFHGHQHEQYSTTLANGITVQGVGLCGVADLSGAVIRKGKLDDERRGRWRQAAT